MSISPESQIPQEILADSVLAHLAGAYFSVGKQLERKTGCSATRGFILNALRNGTVLNQNQIATTLGFDRTVVHRSIKAMVREGLVSESNAPAGRGIHIKLTAKGHAYRRRIIKARIAADDEVRGKLTAEEQGMLVRLLKLIAELKF
ncbi:MAG: MarR family winged helix-turn-helix transcriptional regulator [Acidobacteriota bacterium]